MAVKIAKEFRINNIGDDDLVYHGPVVLDEDFVYLIHNRHRLGSADQSFAIFGLFGFVLHYLDSCTAEVPYPYETAPYAEVKNRLEQVSDLGKVKKTAIVMRIPLEDIQGYRIAPCEYAQLLCNRGHITLYGEVGDVEIVFNKYGIREITAHECCGEGGTVAQK